MVLEELLQTGKENPFCGHLFITMGPPWWFSVNNLPSDAGDSGLILGVGRSPGEGNDKPLQYSCLKNSMDRGDWVGYNPWGRKRVRHDLVTKTRTTLITLRKKHYPLFDRRDLV